MCEKLNCVIKKGYFYCKDTGERCPDGLFDKHRNVSNKVKDDWDFYVDYNRDITKNLPPYPVSKPTYIQNETRGLPEEG
jgi:hypothetical protein